MLRHCTTPAWEYNSRKNENVKSFLIVNPTTLLFSLRKCFSAHQKQLRQIKSMPNYTSHNWLTVLLMRWLMNSFARVSLSHKVFKTKPLLLFCRHRSSITAIRTVPNKRRLILSPFMIYKWCFESLNVVEYTLAPLTIVTWYGTQRDPADWGRFKWNRKRHRFESI